MTSICRLRALVLGGAIAVSIACGTDREGLVLPPFAPSPPDPAAAAGHYAVRVTNGITRTPVTAATLRVGGQTLATDALGRVEVPNAAACTPATFIAIGFLDRRLCLHTPAAGFTPTVTLWPVEDEAERIALRAFAFRGDQLVRRGFMQVDPRSSPSDQVATAAAWQRAARQLREVTGGHFVVELPGNVEALQDGTIVRPWTSAAECVTTPAERVAWVAVAGFCAGRYIGPAYPLFISVVLVAPEWMGDEAMALRVLLAEFGLGPHPGPGLMNERAPDTTLSDFELRTLRMISQRDRPYPGSIMWPDTEF